MLCLHLVHAMPNSEAHDAVADVQETSDSSAQLDEHLQSKLNLSNCSHISNSNSVYFGNTEDSIEYVNYEDERQMPDIMRLIQKDLSEPYSIYTYRYFIHNWPQLCFLVSEHHLILPTGRFIPP